MSLAVKARTRTRKLRRSTHELEQIGRGRERWITRRRVMKRKLFLLLAKNVDTRIIRNGFCCATIVRMGGTHLVSDPRLWSFLRVIGSVQLVTTNPCSLSLDPNLKSLTYS